MEARWDGLFADMEAQLAAVRAAELVAEVADRTRAELATVALADRLRAHVGSALTVRTSIGTAITGELVDVAAQWLLLGERGWQCLVPITAVDDVAGLGLHVAAPEPAVLRALGLGHALRALARDRVVVRLVTRSGDLRGRLQRVGADFVEVTADTGERRPGRPETRTVPFGALVLLHSV